MNIFRSTIPFQRLNNDLILNQDQWNTLCEYDHIFKNKTYVHEKIQGLRDDGVTRYYAEFLHYSFVDVISETVGDYPYPYFSEKTWRSINTGMPFMLINGLNSLARLKDLGFITFNNWWDESYDTKLTVADRIDSVVKNLKNLSSLSLSELQNIKLEMLPVLEHNQKHLAVLKTTELQNIAKLL